MLRYASVFIKNQPDRTIESLYKFEFEEKDVPKLVPAFMNISRDNMQTMDKAKNFVIEYCINKRKSQDKTVHNLALYFYAERNKPEELLSYLKNQENQKEKGTTIHFEVDYALNVCKQKEKEISSMIDVKNRTSAVSSNA